MGKENARFLVSVVGALCLAAGVLFGWIAATQRGPARDLAAAPVATRDRIAAPSGDAQAAATSEGWSRVAQGAYALAKSENAAAQSARRQALDAAARAEKAAARSEAAAAAAKASMRAALPATSAPLARRPAPARRAEPHVAAARYDGGRRDVAAPDEACRRAIIFERSAAVASREAKYNAAMSGLAMNAHCAEPQRTLDEAYLLAQRASALSTLHAGDWKSDLRRSDALLALCVERPERYGTTRARCRTRLKKNERIRATAAGRP